MCSKAACGASDHLRVTAQLVNSADGYHLWSDRYDRELKDIFAVQDEIAQAVVSALRQKLVGAPAGQPGDPCDGEPRGV